MASAVIKGRRISKLKFMQSNSNVRFIIPSILFPPIQKHNGHHHYSSEKVNRITLYSSRLNSFDRRGDTSCCPCNAVHGSIHNVSIEPCCRSPNQIENYFFSDEEIDFINVKLAVSG